MRFLHISDLHYHPALDGRSSRNLREQLPIYIENKKLQADELFITGDYIYAKHIEKDSIDEAVSNTVEYIQKIANAAGIKDVTHIHLIPGNHDRKRGKRKKQLKKIRDSYSVAEGTFKPSYLFFLKKKFYFFYMVCDRLYGKDNPWGGEPLHTYRVVNNTVILYLNTAIIHDSSDDRGNLIIGTDEIARLLDKISEDYQKLPIIILAHHSLEFFNRDEKMAVEALLRKYKVFLYLCGDAHDIWCRRINGYLEITMGCLKSDAGVKTAFLYGNTKTGKYEAHFWDGKYDGRCGWAPYEQFNRSIPSKRVKPKLYDRDIQKNQDLLKRELLLPWLKSSKSYQAVFPEVFIHPDMEGTKIPGTISYSELVSQYTEKNIALIGDAGIGKSTLLRYIYLFDNSNFEYLYLKASSLRKTSAELTSYEDYIIAILTGEIGKPKKHRVILLDEMDEAFVNSPEELQRFIERLEKKSDKIAVWFGWRSEHYFQFGDIPLQRFLDNVLSLKKWSSTCHIQEYVNKYSQLINKPELKLQFFNVYDKYESVQNFSETPFQLILLLYLLETGSLTTEEWKRFEVSNHDPYILYYQFFHCWVQKECSRGSSSMTDEEVLHELQRISQALYYGNNYVVTCNDTAVTDLLVYSNIKSQDKKEAIAFYHRSLCAFFYALGIFSAITSERDKLVSVLNQPLRDDVTNFVRGALNTIQNSEQLSSLQNNLMEIYQQITEHHELTSDKAPSEMVVGLSDEEIFYVKNELIYFITRLPHQSNNVDLFVEQAYQQETNIYLKLDLAYGAVLTGPSWVGLDYAKKLTPGTEEDLANRSWTLAYFGDVQANPYHYRDDGTCLWAKSRKARLDRFQSSKRKAVRFRILDFPLMYCFYASRNWADINMEELNIIKCASIDNEEYSNEEMEFLAQQKEKLVSEYEKRLRDKC